MVWADGFGGGAWHNRGMLRRCPSVLTLLVLSACSAGEDNQSPGGSPAGGSPPKAPSVGAPEAPAENVIPEGDCTGAPGSLYALSVRQLATAVDVPLCKFEGKPLLLINGASNCGYTYQYEGFQALYAKYKEQGFYVLAFPSDSFNQELDDEEQVSDKCTTKYGIKFPVFAIAPVVDKGGAEAQPVYKWLYAQPDMATPVAWNFEKFLVGKDGKVVKRWLSSTAPTEGGEIDLAIQAELAK